MDGLSSDSDTGNDWLNTGIILIYPVSITNSLDLKDEFAFLIFKQNSETYLLCCVFHLLRHNFTLLILIYTSFLFAVTALLVFAFCYIFICCNYIFTLLEL